MLRHVQTRDAEGFLSFNFFLGLPFSPTMKRHGPASSSVKTDMPQKKAKLSGPLEQDGSAENDGEWTKVEKRKQKKAKKAEVKLDVCLVFCFRSDFG